MFQQRNIFIKRRLFSKKINIRTKKLGVYLETKPVSSLLFELLKNDFKDTINNK